MVDLVISIDLSLAGLLLSARSFSVTSLFREAFALPYLPSLFQANLYPSSQLQSFTASPPKAWGFISTYYTPALSC